MEEIDANSFRSTNAARLPDLNLLESGEALKYLFEKRKDSQKVRFYFIFKNKFFFFLFFVSTLYYSNWKNVQNPFPNYAIR